MFEYISLMMRAYSSLSACIVGLPVPGAEGSADARTAATMAVAAAIAIHAECSTRGGLWCRLPQP